MCIGLWFLVSIAVAGYVIVGQLSGAPPRYRGSREACTPTHPRGKAARTLPGTMWYQPTTSAAVAPLPRAASRMSSGFPYVQCGTSASRHHAAMSTYRLFRTGAAL